MNTLRALWREDRLVVAALLGLAVIGGASIFVPLAASHDPLAIGDVLQTRLAPPFSRDSVGAYHVLGTDRFGRDLFVRMMLAARISLFVGVIGSLLSVVLGVVVGALAGWRGGWFDRVGWP
jgi:peptide/nickel transport system permease protein